MSSTVRLPPKRDVALALLEASTVFIHLDPRADSVRVPPWFKRQPRLVLQIGLNMPVPIPDLNLDDDSVSCTLSFNRSPHFCWIPWSSVFALVGEDGRGMVWPDDIPPEVAAEMQSAQQKQQTRGHLRAVRDDEPKPAAVRLVQSDKSRQKRAKKRALRAERASQPEPQPEPQTAEARRQPVPLRAEAPKASAPSARAQSSAGTSNGRKTKRELPPYLRVVK
jgi:stringent starvation protein B